MSDRKLAKIVQKLFSQIWKLSRSLSKGLVTWLLRTAMLMTRRRATAGFVLPTAVFLVLVVSLTAGALSYRAYNNSTRVIGNVQSREIYNAATPAIDRARAKLEYLFKDPRYPGGVPSEGFLVSMMLNDGREVKGVKATPNEEGIKDATKEKDPYTFLDEERVDLNGSGNDNAWVYHDDTTKSSIIYSITFSTPPDDANAGSGTSLYGWQKLLKMNDSDKAKGTGDPAAGPFVRTGPLNNSEAVTCSVSGGGSSVEAGWYADAGSTATLRKRFQVNAFVVKDEAGQSTGKPASFTTLEFLQDRQLDRGNKWGAWFRNDLEIYPGATFNWNGAMHTEGSLLIGQNEKDGSAFNAYLISSPSSCLFTPTTNSEISIREYTNPDNATEKFYGVAAAGRMSRAGYYGGSFPVHVYDGKGYDDTNNLEEDTDWKKGSKNPIGISQNPSIIVTQDGYAARQANLSNVDDRLTLDEIQENVFFEGERFTIDTQGTRPYVDDTYRADDRYGPKAVYTSEVKSPDGQIGQPIPDSDTNKSKLTSQPVSSDDVGLDGYWERRAMTSGLRILVGQRLELGNPFGWTPPQDRPDTTRQQPDVTPAAGDGNVLDLRQSSYAAATTGVNADPNFSDNEGDPLYPPHRFNDPTRAHEERQRQALRDNLAAVQGAAVYHYSLTGGTTPAACLATTAHPGTPLTLQQSVNFLPNKYISATEPWFDFFYGKGTNGWEFTPPDITSTAVQTALLNLATFAGDYDPISKLGGAYPPTQGDRIYPDPVLTMWGNFSNLRRALTDSINSPADASYQHTAACTLGMLAHSINQVRQFTPGTGNEADKSALGDLLLELMNGNVADGEVLDKWQLGTYNYAQATGAPTPANYNPRDYDRVTPEMFLAALRKKLADPALSIPEPENDDRYKLALLIHEQFQIRRDRTFGFRPSPAANTWNYNPFVVQLPGVSNSTAWSAACDPNIFNVVGSTAVDPTSADKSGANINITNDAVLGAAARQRLALSRMCSTVIPPGSVHDFPGDYNYPARGITAGDNVKFLPDSGATAILQRVTEAELPTYLTTSNNNLKFRSAPLNATPYIDDDKDYKRALIAPEFPSLYYIFPEFAHTQAGSDTVPAGIDHRQPGGNTTLDNAASTLPAAFRPWAEPYVAKAVNLNGAGTYTALTGTTISADIAYPPDGIAITNKPGAITSFNYKALPVFPVADQSVSLGITPRALGDWKLPKSTTVTVPNAASNAPPNLIRTPAGIAAVPFVDRVLFNGREWLPSRVLDIDLDLLRNNSPGTGETWLPVSGIVYAFREDAVREDAIVRPKDDTTVPPDLADVKQTNARTPGSETDPTLAKGTISTKPVDFVPDPDRRPHGFRLRNGAQLRRTAGGVPDNKNIRGLSFFSDNLAYIMGDFNKHQTTGGADLEEFIPAQHILNKTYNSEEFYTDRKNLDDRFARPTEDLWRPSEVLADTVTLLSNTFCDGSVIDTFMTAGEDAAGHFLPIGTGTGNNAENRKVYQQLGGSGAAVYNSQARALFGQGCVTNGATSFLNQNRPEEELLPNWDWIRENPGDPFSPVKISRNGNSFIVAPPPTTASAPKTPVEYSGKYNIGATPVTIAGSYFKISEPSSSDIDEDRPLQNASDTTINTIMISGIVPSRDKQSYGGLQNFPRFLEWWEGKNLKFLGAFLQLNFSNYATAPFDQDVWEPGLASVTNEITDYYGSAPNRRWGYDVALQLAPAGPAATRFVTAGTKKNEFYNEPAANDPYMQSLCTALKTNSAAALGGVPMTNLNCPK
ncbi:MAG: hypothetical protein HC866_08960 [Leptolyngbyaceae cyanobacterium RU_5_1]|nr:hypothetical protein [Leptolyngbyaceae cyanobacterium RU_5_1]